MPIAANDAHAIEDMAGYVARNPLSLKRLVYIDGHKAVIYRALKPNPSLGQNFEAMDPLDWLARMTYHIPDPGRHRTQPERPRLPGAMDDPFRKGL